jgi:glycosyltransferase involved in cell wall biosynthesis
LRGGRFLNPSPSVLAVAPEILEMQACGVPVLTVRSGCISNVVADGQNGFISADEQALKERLVAILVKPEMALAGISRESRDFEGEWRSDWDVIARKIHARSSSSSSQRSMGNADAAASPANVSKAVKTS